MITVIGVRFKKAGKVYYFDPSDVWPRPGEYVVVETTRGLELGEVVTSAREVTDDQIVQPLKKVIRAALAEDVQRAEINSQKEKEAFPICQERIRAHKLDMKLVDVEYTFDNSKIIFYFTADGRVDFRELVKDLASIFKMRIELRQIGVRDEAKMLGGLGACGRPICCAAFLGDFQPLSIKMAKEQNLSLNPVKISGQCGRLMCCLRYEQDFYEQMLKKIPKVGSEVITPDGLGVVSEIFVIREKVRVRIRNNDDSYDIREFNVDDVYRPGKQPPKKVEEPEEPVVKPAEPAAEEPAPVEEAAQAEFVQEEAPRRRSPRGRSGRKPKQHQLAEAEAVAAAQTPVEEPEPAPAEPAEPEAFEPAEEGEPREGGAPRRRRRRGGRNRHKKSGDGQPNPSPEGE